MYSRRPPWRPLAALAAILLSAAGCAVKPQADSGSGDRARAGELAHWRLSGRLALSNGRDGGSGQLQWEQLGERAELRFHGAFGQRGWRLVTTPGEATLELSGGGHFSATRVEDLVRDHVGWEVPVKALSYWVRGVVAPNAPARTRRDRDGRLSLIRQHRWLVEYDGFLDIDGLALPRKITATKDGNRVRLLIKQWGIDSPS